MRIGVVIVTYNRIKLLKECITRVLNQTQTIDTVIVVDNNSNDGTRDYLDSLNDTSLTFCPINADINENLKKDFNVELLGRTICDIYMNSDSNKKELCLMLSKLYKKDILV